jgi:putative ABC transport system permease protein
VAADIRSTPWDHDISPVIYQPFRQAPSQRVHFLLRTTGDPRALIAAARTEAARIDPNQPVQDVRTYRKTMDHALIGLHYVASMMAVFGVIALMLSAAGVYGVMACSVAERTREIGLRRALGAQDSAVVWMVGRWGAHDIVSFAAGILVLSAAAMLACYVPVRRALAVDPIVALRTE